MIISVPKKQAALPVLTKTETAKYIRRKHFRLKNIRKPYTSKYLRKSIINNNSKTIRGYNTDRVRLETHFTI
jgi:hypothetical protein